MKLTNLIHASPTGDFSEPNTPAPPRNLPDLKVLCNECGIPIPSFAPTPIEIILLVESRLAEHQKHFARHCDPGSGDYSEWKSVHDNLAGLLDRLQNFCGNRREKIPPSSPLITASLQQAPNTPRRPKTSPQSTIINFQSSMINEPASPSRALFPRLRFSSLSRPFPPKSTRLKRRACQTPPMRLHRFMHVLAFAAFPFLATANSPQADQWRAEHRLIDLHMHLDYDPERLARAVRIMDASGIGIGINLSGDITTSKDSKPSPFEQNKTLTDKLYPGRFITYMNLDYSKWDEPNFSEDAVKQVEEGHRLGAAGLKEYKRLGLYLRDKNKKLIRIDDPKLDPVWEKCGELNMPISIHVADPKAFWEPYNEKNERWKELRDHKAWWFGDPKVYPKREELLEALNRVIERHPKTTFVAVHFANNAEDLDWVDRQLDRFPNMNADLAARIPEIGRQDPEKVRRIFIKHADRIFFATDFQVHETMILGSSGSGPAPTEDDANIFFAKHWRWMETYDHNFAHMTPIQGDWTISGISLPDDVLRKIYFDNARKLLARSMPYPIMHAAHAETDFPLDGKLTNPTWQRATPMRLEYDSASYTAMPAVSTPVRALWTDHWLYLGYDCPITEISVFEPPYKDKERLGLWDKDVVEAFIAPDPSKLDHYTEYEVAPTGEKLDLILASGKSDFDWSSGFEAASVVDKSNHRWTVEMRIPMKAFKESPPQPGEKWRFNLYRIDRDHKAFLALNPTLRGSYHTPERFATLEFDK